MSLKGPIILVYDDEDDQYLIGLSLKSLQLPNELLYFGNGQEALYYLATTQEQPFLILCDVNMPIMNGSELRRQINADKVLRQKSTPFIFLTTAANTQLVQEAYDNTVQGFFKKAPDYAGLEKQLESIVVSFLHPNSM